MNLEARPRELNIFAQPNQVLRFAYPVKNLDGTPYNEPYLTNVYLTVYTSQNKKTALKRYTFADGISHANNTNIISFAVPILDTELPFGKHYYTINHVRTISAVVENNVLFAGAFEITNDVREWASDMEGTTNIANVIGLREELDERPKYAQVTINNTINNGYIIELVGATFLTKYPIVQIYSLVLGNTFLNNTVTIKIVNDTTLQVDGGGGIYFVKAVIIY
jgi:hypothetical protein